MKAIIYRGKKLYLHNILRLQTRRAAKLGTDPSNMDDIYSIFVDAMNVGVCKYCGCTFVLSHERFSPSLDHILPMSKGGTNEVKNLHVCCIWCNLLKRSMTGHEFLSIMDKMGDYMQYAGDDVFRNRFSNRFKELRDSSDRVYIQRNGD